MPVAFDLPESAEFSAVPDTNELKDWIPMPGFALFQRAIGRNASDRLHLVGNPQDACDFIVARVIRVNTTPFVDEFGRTRRPSIQPGMLVLLEQHRAQRHQFTVSKDKRLVMCRAEYAPIEVDIDVVEV